MPANIYSLSPLLINSTVLPIADLKVPQDVIKVIHQHSGNEFPTAVATPGGNPKITFRTPFAGAYTLFGLSATLISTLNVFLAQFVNLVRAPTNSVSFSLASTPGAATGYGHIAGWSVGSDAILMADVEIYYLSYDGQTHPIATPQTGQTLPVLASQPQLHTLGPVSVNGTIISGLDSAGCAMNQQVEVRRSDGDTYPRIAARFGGQPMLTGLHKDPVNLWSQLGYIGAGISSNVVQYFRSYSLTTGLVAAANSVSVTMAAGRINPKALDVGQARTAAHDFEATGTSTTATNPLAISLSATAPTPP